MAESGEVIVTGEASKLPPDLAALFDPARPLPAGVRFFEKRVLAQDFVKALGVTIVLLLSGAITTGFGILLIPEAIRSHPSSGVDYLPLAFGVVCLFAAWMMIASIKKRWQLMRQQKSGTPTRLGIFLWNDFLIEANEFGFCVIPRPQFRGLSGLTIRYTLKNTDRSFRLPAALIKNDPATMIAAIREWENG